MKSPQVALKVTQRGPMDGGPRLTIGQCIVGAGAATLGAAVPGFLSTPLAHADEAIPMPSASTPVANSSTSAAESWMYGGNAGGLYEGHETAYQSLVDMGQDSMTQYANDYGAEMQFYSDVIGDIGTVGNLVEGGVGDVGSLMGGIGGIAGAAAAAGTPSTADLVSAISNASGTLHSELQGLESAAGPGNQYESYAANQLADFQWAIHHAADNLPTANGADASNWGLNNDLEYVLSAENAEQEYVTNLNLDVASNAGPAQIIADNSLLYDGDQLEYTYLQDAIGGFSWDHPF